MSEAVEAPKVFISYSWAVQDRVIELAERLFSDHVHVVLDVYDLKDGQDKYAFMEQTVNDPSISRVLIICDKTYTDKANARTGGVGDEVVIITPEIYGNTKQEKFIPIIFEKDDEGKACCPHFIKSRIYIDLSDDSDRYESEYEKLLRNIHNKPIHKRPTLGQMPVWLEEDAVNLSPVRSVLKQIQGDKSGNKVKRDFLLKKAEEALVEAACAYKVNPDKPIETELINAIGETKSFRDLFMEYCEVLIESGNSIANGVTSVIEALYNSFQMQSENYSSELHKFMLWELMIDVTAFCVYYELFEDLHQVVTHPYLLTDRYHNGLAARNFMIFRSYLESVETKCKPKCDTPNLITLSGRILITREKKPYLTKESISSADLVLYHLGQVLDFPGTSTGWDYWFPDSYVYHKNQAQTIWQRMISVEHCKKIFPLFGVSAIDELRACVAKSIPDRNMRHRNDYFDIAPCIQDSISLEKIGTIK